MQQSISKQQEMNRASSWWKTESSTKLGHCLACRAKQAPLALREDTCLHTLKASANCERGFSQTNIIKSILSNRMLVQLLSSILTIKESGWTVNDELLKQVTTDTTTKTHFSEREFCKMICIVSYLRIL